MSDTKKLTKTEFYKLQWFSERAARLRLEEELKRKDIRIKQLNRVILQYKIRDEDLEISSLEKEEQNIKAQAKELKLEQSEVLKRVRKRLKLDGRFGYDEETLEVIED